MRIAVLSDIHGNLSALKAVVADLGRRDVDAVVNLGDSLSGPLLPLETARFLMAQDWLQIAGNHERQVLTQGPDRWSAEDAYTHSCLTPTELDWLAALPPGATLGEDVLLCHGTPASDFEYFLESVDPGGIRPASAWEVNARLGGVSAGLVLCGHSHLPRAVRAASGTLIVNPGSVGLPAYDDNHPHPHRVENRSPDARYAIVERRPEGWVSELIAVPYDHRVMAELAWLRGMTDWERALLSGYMDAPP